MPTCLGENPHNARKYGISMLIYNARRGSEYEVVAAAVKSGV